MSTPIVASRMQNRRGTQSQFNALYPPGYNGTGGADISVWPNILLPGEIALCTDTRRVFIGNLNGEYFEIDPVNAGSLSSIVLIPLVLTLPPAATFTIIPELSYSTTPFFSLLYDITDSSDPNWNLVGTNFSKNGEMKITAVLNFVPAPAIPPFPAITPVSLLDVGNEINLSSPCNISFMAQYNLLATGIDILYMHDFPGSLKFSTGSVHWVDFA